MNPLQALITGWLYGSLCDARSKGLAVSAEPVVDEHGQAKPEIIVIGEESGTKLRITVEVEEEGA